MLCATLVVYRAVFADGGSKYGLTSRSQTSGYRERLQRLGGRVRNSLHYSEGQILLRALVELNVHLADIGIKSTCSGNDHRRDVLQAKT